jgi:hypothetical protein
MLASGPRPGPVRTVGDTARAVILLAAPDEAAFFDDLSAAYFQDPARAMGLGKARSEPTGFPLYGVPEVVTPIVVGALTSALGAGITSVAGGWWQRLRHRWQVRKIRAKGSDVLREPQPSATSGTVTQAEDFVRRNGAALDPETRNLVMTALATVLLQDAVGQQPESRDSGRDTSETAS